MSDTFTPPPSAQPTPTHPVPKAPKFRGAGWRFAIVAALTVVMFVPLIAVSFVIQDRAHYQKSAVHEVSQLWGGPITLSGPFLIIPVGRRSPRTRQDEAGGPRTGTTPGGRGPGGASGSRGSGARRVGEGCWGY